jgi:aminopeptidase N
MLWILVAALVLAVAGTVLAVTSRPEVRARQLPVTPVSGPAGATGLGDPYYPQAGNGGYDVQSYRLELRYDPGPNQLIGHVVIAATATQDLARFDLDFGSLDITAFTVNGRPAHTQHTGETELQVSPARLIAKGTNLTVDVRYEGKPGGKGFHTTYDGAYVFGEPDAATDWFPSNDHPRDKATFDFAITVPAGLNAIANGVQKGQSTSGGWTTWRWHESAPMATYLATMVVGHYRITTGTAAGVPLYDAVGTRYPSKDADAAIAQTGPIIEYLASVFGPYPFDAVGGVVVDASRVGGALETQTRPLYAPEFFQAPSGSGSTVIAHELAHQWFGDSVSVHDWRDIWLNEGFATYAEWLWDEHTGGPSPQARFNQVYSSQSADLWTVPPADPGVKQLFGASVYQRGAMTLQVLRDAVGDSAFFAILRGWAAARRYGNGSTAEFIALAETVSGKQLDGLFQSWLYGKTRPPV